MKLKCFICLGKRTSEDRICNDCLTKLNIFRDGVKKIIETMDVHQLDSIIDKFYWTAYELCKIRGIEVN